MKLGKWGKIKRRLLWEVGSFKWYSVAFLEEREAKSAVKKFVQHLCLGSLYRWKLYTWLLKLSD